MTVKVYSGLCMKYSRVGYMDHKFLSTVDYLLHTNGIPNELDKRNDA